METWLYVLVLLSGQPGEGRELVGSHSYFSEQECVTDARLIAQGMYIKSNERYGFYCRKVDFEPPHLQPKP